jgi:hypothetical protein
VPFEVQPTSKHAEQDAAEEAGWMMDQLFQHAAAAAAAAAAAGDAQANSTAAAFAAAAAAACGAWARGGHSTVTEEEEEEDGAGSGYQPLHAGSDLDLSCIPLVQLNLTGGATGTGLSLVRGRACWGACLGCMLLSVWEQAAAQRRNALSRACSAATFLTRRKHHRAAAVARRPTRGLCSRRLWQRATQTTFPATSAPTG